MLRPKSLPYDAECRIYSMERDWYFRIVVAFIVLMPFVACRLADGKGEASRCVTGTVQQHATQGAPVVTQKPCIVISR